MEFADRGYQLQQAQDALKLSELSGFDYSNTGRNSHLMTSFGSSSSHLPTAWKTGTTIVGVLYNGGVILGADTRATGGSEVVDKNCEKIHYLAPNIYCCGAGTAADTEKTTELIASQLELLRLASGTPSRVIGALTRLKRLLFKYQGHIGAALILGGVDATGPQLYEIQPHGSTQKLPYMTMGSGSLAAMAVFESRFREDMSEIEAIELVRDGIRAGIMNDLGSGSNVDITVIRADGSTEKMRTYEETAGKANTYKAQYPHPQQLNPKRGTTYVIAESFRPHRKNIVREPLVEVDPEAVKAAKGDNDAMDI